MTIIVLITQPTRRVIQSPPDITRPTESSLAKQKPHDSIAKIAIAFLAAAAAGEAKFDDEPKSLEEAKASPEWLQWHEAILRELATFQYLPLFT